MKRVVEYAAGAGVVVAVLALVAILVSHFRDVRQLDQTTEKQARRVQSAADRRKPLIAGEFVAADQAVGVHDDEPVLGVALGGEVKAYPLRFFLPKEHINDQVGGASICATWCPMTASAAVHGRQIDGRELTFVTAQGPHGDNLVLTDIQTNSRWSQLQQRAISGPLRGSILPLIPAIHTTWKHWKSMHPNSLVIDLQPTTGPFKDFGMLMSPLGAQVLNGRLPHRLEVVLGVVLPAGVVKAYPFSRLARGSSLIFDTIDGETYHIHYHQEAPAAWITDEQGVLVPSLTAYWEGWSKFYPHTEVFRHDG